MTATCFLGAEDTQILFAVASMKLQGWQANGAVTGAVVIGLLKWFLVARWNAPTITSTIDATGRCSLFLFSIAFTASSIHRFCPSSLTRWTRQNRRWIGLSFAASHFIHLALILKISLHSVFQNLS